jgi:transcriptional regulator with XRE-family HTH domain
MSAPTARRHTPYTKFKALLNEREIKQAQVAVLLRKSPSAFNQNLNGTGGDFSLSEVREICTLLEISADEFFICPKVSNMKQKNPLHYPGQ